MIIIIIIIIGIDKSEIFLNVKQITNSAISVVVVMAVMVYGGKKELRNYVQDNSSVDSSC